MIVRLDEYLYSSALSVWHNVAFSIKISPSWARGWPAMESGSTLISSYSHSNN